MAAAAGSVFRGVLKSKPRVVVTGASRGIGLEFVRQLAKANCRVVGTCRSPGKAKDLQALQAQHKESMIVLPLDVTDEKTVRDAAAAVDKAFGGVDLLINNAGAMPADGFRQTIENANLAEARQVLDINIVGVLASTQKFLPLLRKAEKGRKPVVVNLSSGLGSISQAGGTMPIYRLTKAAVNMLTKVSAGDCGDVGFLALHPGWVQTDMGTGAAPLTPERAVRDMLRTIDSFDADKQSGAFLDKDGAVLPY